MPPSTATSATASGAKRKINNEKEKEKMVFHLPQGSPIRRRRVAGGPPGGPQEIRQGRRPRAGRTRCEGGAVMMGHTYIRVALPFFFKKNKIADRYG